MKINVGSLVHWYEYSSDMVIINGGWGTVVEKINKDFVNVLTSSGVKKLPVSHCDLEDAGCEA